jgi:late competence protein required for DNA uptake (superfamily II DNA/RNA helicase)
MEANKKDITKNYQTFVNQMFIEQLKMIAKNEKKMKCRICGSDNINVSGTHTSVFTCLDCGTRWKK